ncbi:hypothetical protein BI026_gp31 [Rhodovulum phage vB_RhkS_P1]|nr:hypothetical protein BI026_gp31 [Rhodovulum phage vB_RhkS_P1]ANT39902.1 hypothetical protein Rhks_31 [Rhodovulum phage vB_RhkS_P1]
MIPSSLPIPAIHIPARHDLVDRRLTGSFWIGPPDPDEVGARWMWFVCPCGCGQMRPITIGDRFKPAEAPSWYWNGSLTEVTLHPSVNCEGHWHGWLRGGQWVLA